MFIYYALAQTVAVSSVSDACILGYLPPAVHLEVRDWRAEGGFHGF